MKTLFIVLSLFAFAWASPKINDAAIEDMKEAARECQKEAEISYEQFKAFYVGNELPNTRAEKCFVSCAAKYMGAVKNGRFDMDNIRAFNRKRYDDADIIAKADDIAQSCSTKLPTDMEDECEYALEVVKCIKEEARKRNF